LLTPSASPMRTSGRSRSFQPPAGRTWRYTQAYFRRSSRIIAPQPSAMIFGISARHLKRKGRSWARARPLCVYLSSTPRTRKDDAKLSSREPGKQAPQTARAG
jgi:hypothetical protein